MSSDQNEHDERNERNENQETQSPQSTASTPTLADTESTHDTQETQPVNECDGEDRTLRKRPWRRRITPWQKIIEYNYEGKGTEEQPYVVDWMEEDEENPMTWNEGYKWLSIVSVAVATLAVAMSSSTLSGATRSIEESFPGYKVQAYVMVTSGFVLGFVVGPLFWAPLSEVYGRRLIFLVSYVFFTIFNGAVVSSQNIWTLIILRFFAGTAGSSPLTNAGGTVSDLLSGGERGLGMAIFAAAPFTGPAIGPIIGGFLGETGGWRWVAALIAIFCGILTVYGFFIVPETYAPVLLRKRADMLSEATGKSYRSKYEKDKPIQIGETLKKAIARPWIFLFKEPVVIMLSLYLAIIYALLYMLFGAFPIVFEELRGWSPGVSGLAFIGPLVGFMSAIAYIIFYENPRYAKKLNEEGWLPPEQRLPPAILGGILLPIGLFAFAWTAAPARIFWLACLICSAPFGMGMVLVFLSVFNYLIDSYLLYAASVLAANSVLRSLFGVGFPLFVSPMFANLGVNWAVSLIGFLAAACAPLPILFYFKGEPVRRMSKFGREADDMGQMMRRKAKEEKSGEAA